MPLLTFCVQLFFIFVSLSFGPEKCTVFLHNVKKYIKVLFLFSSTYLYKQGFFGAGMLMTPLQFLKMKMIVKNLSLLNSLHSSLCFMFEKELDSSLLFLDIPVEKHKTGFITSVYRKLTFTGQYIHWDSYNL